MNKYDFGYELSEGSTAEWAFHKVIPGSKVLELGPSIGTLISHLVNDKNCIADIVEIDEESGKKAARFARVSCIGPQQGDLEQDIWFQKLADNRYDYIIILDVLEHIKNPLEVLKKLSQLLAAEGMILLSIPNIAHNSVILHLLQNKFEYTSVGLLDNTHVHFYTYQSIKSLLKEAGLVTAEEQVKQENVGNNEITAVYGTVSRNVESFLKTRYLGTAYQFLFTIKNGMAQADIPLQYKEDALYEMIVFSHAHNDVIFQLKINPQKPLRVIFDVPADTTELRIDPLNSNCILTNLEIIGFTATHEQKALMIKEFTGNQYEDLLVFYDDDPQIYVKFDPDIKQISFSCSFLAFDDQTLETLSKSRDIVRLYEQQKQELQLQLIDSSKSEEIYRTQAAEAKTELAEYQGLLKAKSMETDKIMAEKLELEVSLKNQAEAKCQLLDEIQNMKGLLSDHMDAFQKLLSEKQNIEERLTAQLNITLEREKELEQIKNSFWGKIYCHINKDKN